MDIFPLEPGELLVGFRGRLATANHCVRPHQIHMLLQKHFPPAEGNVGQGVVPTLAEALRTPMRSLLTNNTVYALFAAFAKENERPYQGSYASSWLRLARPRLALCPACVDEDMARIHTSYWRRDHQLPGLFHCVAHGEPLRFIPVPVLLTARPHDAMRTASLGPVAALEAAAHHPVCVRAILLMQALLTGLDTATLFQIKNSLRAEARVRIGHLEARAGVAQLSLKILQEIPAQWLSDFMPHLKKLRSERLIFVSAALEDQGLSLSAAAVTLLLALLDVPIELARSMMGTQPLRGQDAK